MHSFTDEQLLNLVNNTIKSKTEFEINEFTGGSVQITSTNNNQVIKYKVSLFFGYKQKNPISRTIDINDNLVSIWINALHLKVKSIQVSNNGMDYSELNALMNNLPNKVDSNKVLSISKGINTPLTTSSKENFSFSLKKLTQYENVSSEYKEKLKEEIEKLNLSLSYEDFEDSLIAKGYKYKNFLIAYSNWCKKDFNKSSSKQSYIDRCINESARTYEAPIDENRPF